MTKIKALIVEDEKPGRDLLINYIADHENIEVLDYADNGFDAVKKINELKPDLVFLDIQIPKLTGFEVLDLIEEMPTVIFTTAYNEYALKAFEISAVDYLLKPYSRKRFSEAVLKAEEKIALGNKGVEEKKLIETSNNESNLPLQRVVIKDRNKISVVSVADIHYLESQDDYVMIYTADKKYLKQKTMKYFESSLDSKQFVRIHRQYIVNVDQISMLEQYEKDSYIIKILKGDTLKVSKAGFKAIKEVLDM